MADIKKGISRIRSFMKGKTINEELAKSIKAKKDSQLQAVIKQAEAKGMTVLDLLKAIKKLPKGNLSKETLKAKLNLDAGVDDGIFKKKKGRKIVEEEAEEEEKPKKGKRKDEVASKPIKDAEAPVSKGVKLVIPKSVTCPDEDELGNEVVLVVGKDGLFGCGVLAQTPAD